MGDGEAKSLGMTVGFPPVGALGSGDVPLAGPHAATAAPIMSIARIVSSVFRSLVNVYLLCVPEALRRWIE